MAQKNIFVPTDGRDSWKGLLSDKDKHWKKNHSAMQVATSWESKGDLPKEITRAFDKVKELAAMELLLALPEFKVKLQGTGKWSQNDVLALLSNETSLAVVAVEAKAKESFDKPLEAWLKDASENKETRLKFLMDQIQFPKLETEKLSYQLFHRLASAVIMAKKFHAKNAVMLIQSFEELDKDNHYQDFARFIEAYGKEPDKEIPILLVGSESPNIWAVWVHSKDPT